MSFSRRIQKELDQIKQDEIPCVRDIKIDETNILKWEVLIRPELPPFNKGLFRVQIDFPEQFPFRPPVITFLTKIYHPNVDENGHVCLNTVNTENWKPVNKVSKVLLDLIHLINHPQPDHPLRPDVAEEYVKEKRKFMRIAEEYTKRYSEKM